MRVFRAFIRLSSAEKARAIEAAALLTSAWGMVRLLPFARYAPLLGQVGPATPVADASVTPGDAMARAVARALARAARHLPWESTCLMRALAGKIMLRRRGCLATVFVGAAHEKDDRRLGFHAWLHAGGVVVSGGHSREYSVLATFR